MKSKGNIIYRFSFRLFKSESHFIYLAIYRRHLEENNNSNFIY